MQGTSRVSAFRKRRGFTLMELLIAIGIMGILASVVIIAVGPAQALESVRNAERKMYIRQQENAGTQYVIGTGDLPSDSIPRGGDNARPICRTGITDGACINLDDMTPTYIADLPVDRAETNTAVTGYKVFTDEHRRIFVCSHYLPVGDRDRCSGPDFKECIENAVYPISTGGNTVTHATVVGTKIYVLNQITNNVSVIDMMTDTVSTIIPVSTHPQTAVLAGNRLYIFHRSSSTASVIDTTTDTVIASLTVGGDVRQALLVGNKIYAAGANSFVLSIINTTNNTVSNLTMSPGGSGMPNWVTLVGTNLYVSLTGGGIKIVDTVTDTITQTISTPGLLPGRSYLVGTNLYYLNGYYWYNNVKVLNTLTNTFVPDITIPNIPDSASAVLYGTKLYTINYSSANDTVGTVSVIDTVTNTVLSTITVDGNPRHGFIIGGKLHVPTNVAADTSDLAWIPDFNYIIIDMETDTISESLSLGNNPLYAVVGGEKIYVLNNMSNTVSVVDADGAVCN